MGNSSNGPLARCHSDVNLHNSKPISNHQNLHSFTNYQIDRLSQSNHQYRLINFRGQLNKNECFYVLNTLLQQFYSLFKQYNKVVVSDHLCQVTNLGAVKVDFCIDGPQTPLNSYNQLTHSFVTVVSQILQLVCSLSLDKAWFQSAEYRYFEQRLSKVIYRCYTNEDRMFCQLLQEINYFMQKQNIKCNLLAAIIRSHNPKDLSRSQKILTQSALRQKTPYLAHSYSNVTLQTDLPFHIQSNRINMQENPSAFKIKDNSTKIDSHEERVSQFRHTRFPVYRHKVVRTEGQDYFQNMNRQHIRNQASYLSQMPPTERYQIKQYPITQYSRQSSHTQNRHISAQYSMQILNISNNDKNLKISQKVKFKKEENVYANCGQKKDSSDQNHTKIKQKQSSEMSLKKRTSIQQHYKKGFGTQKNSRMYTKSMLDDLARSVEVRDQPSSRSYIF